MLSDILGQAIEAMKHNRRRTMITIVGMAWGIATVVLLLAYGGRVRAGVREHLRAVWDEHDRSLSRADPASRREDRRLACRFDLRRTMWNVSRRRCRA